MEPAQPRDNWNEHWDRYSAAAEHNPAQRYRRKLIFTLLNLERDSTAVRLLDIGSGQGDFALDLSHSFPAAKIMGLELSQSGVELCKQKVPTGTFVQRDLVKRETPSADQRGWATHAVCAEVLEHIDDPVQFLKNVRDYLAPGCRLVVTVPGGPMSIYDRHIGHRTHFRPSELRAMLEAADFDVLQVGGAGFPFFNLYRLVVIARGKKLIDDVDASHQGVNSALALKVMKIFDRLFRFNLGRSPLGWQMIAVARKKP